jgi:hypothetical protein
MKIFALLLLVGHSAFALDCSSVSGRWSQKEAEVNETPTLIEIQKNCKVTLIQTAERHKNECFSFEYLFYSQNTLRAQYGLNTGATDLFGNKCPALTEELKPQLQGNVYNNSDGTLSFAIDFLEESCGGPGKCSSAKFYRI